jgi:hypothetical protein
LRSSLPFALNASSTLRLNVLKIKSFHNAAENISPRAKCDDGRHANARMEGERKMQDTRSLHSLRLFFAEHAQWGKKFARRVLRRKQENSKGSMTPGRGVSIIAKSKETT